MRVRKIEIDGKTYPIVNSNRVLMDLEADGLKIQDIMNTETTSMTAMMKLLRAMMEAGARWARRNGKDALEVPALEDLADSIDMGDMERISQMLGDVIEGERNVEAIPPKN